MANQDRQTYDRLPEPPLVPQYDALPQEVEDFLRDYFKSQLSLSDAASLEKAQQLPVNGPALYNVPEEKFQEIYGPMRNPLFDYLQDSMYGPVRHVLYRDCHLSHKNRLEQ